MTIPTWSRWLLGFVVPDDRCDDVLGDLEEVHRQRCAHFGGSTLSRARAWILTSAETWLLLGAFLLCRFRGMDWTLPWIAGSEIRLGLRLIRKQPVMSATAIIALAMGIGVATTGFTVLDSTINGKLPFSGGERFVRLFPREMPVGWLVPLAPEHHRLIQTCHSFEHFGAEQRVELNLLTPSGGVETVAGAWITPASFHYLPYVPIAGRALTAADGEPGAQPVVLLRESLWKRRYGGRRDVIGQAVNIAGKEYSVAGVLGDDAGFPADGEMWLPLGDQRLDGTAGTPRLGLFYFGLLRQGVSLAAARREVTTVSDRFFAEQPPARETQLRLRPYIEPSSQEVLTATLMVTVLILLLVVIAANVANLILARTTARARELAMRTALGASRSRLIGQIGVEVAMLGTIAAGLGLLASQIALGWIESRVLEKPFWLDLSINARILVFVIAATLLTSLVGGVLPAWKATRRDAASTLQAGVRGGGFSLGRVGTLMMVIEIALAVVMLSGALVIARGFSGSHLDETLVLPEGRVLTASISGSRRDDSANEQSKAPDTHLSARVTRALETIPGVVEVGIGDSLPGRGSSERKVLVAPEPGESPTGPRLAAAMRVKPGFLRTFEARVLAGRLFQISDLRPEAAKVVVVNEHFVRKFLAGRNAIGRRIRVAAAGTEEDAPLWREIVGVVPDLGLNGGGYERGAGYYVPWLENPTDFELALLVTDEPSLLTEPLREAIASLDPEIRVHQVVPLEEADASNRAWVASFGKSLVAMGGMVLLLSVVGLYAMISFAVACRTREIGLRVALGATRREILRTVIGDASLHLALGAVLGIILVLAAGFLGVLDKMFAMPLPTDDLWVLPIVVSLLVLAGVMACWVPARRALEIHPAEALRLD